MFYVKLNEPNPLDHTAIAFKFNWHKIIGTIAVSKMTGPDYISKGMDDLTQTRRAGYKLCEGPPSVLPLSFCGLGDL